MITVSNLTIQFGGNDLFKDISFQINPKERIGLVGKNGAGKSTLLKVLMGQFQPESGSIAVGGGMTLGYLPQQLNVDDTRSVLDEALSAFEEINAMQAELDRCTVQLGERTDYETDSYMDLIARVTDLSSHIEMMGGQSMVGEAERTLMGLGFERSDFERHTKEFSGGWRMRIELVKILLKRPGALLLDEPTNHLDIEAIQWLENFLKDYPGSVVLISHDKQFLDAITQRTVEITMGKIHDYKAPYTKYLELRKERREQIKASYDNQQKMISDTEDFIDRFRYKASKSIQVQSRIKQLDKIDRIEIEEEDNSSIHFRFPPAPRSGAIAVEAINLTKKYGEKLILDEISFIANRGEKIAFVGRNGEGKTTFSKIIAGETTHEGHLKLGHNVKMGYYAQNQDELLNPELTVLETLESIAPDATRPKVRDILGSFLFSGESVDKKVKVLSGGECSRLAMAKLLLEPYNLLILDEPTNHLDIRSKDVLKRALQSYDGTMIIVSHDRDFLDGLVSHLYEFRNHAIKERMGTIYDFLRQREQEMRAESSKGSAGSKAAKAESKTQFEEKKAIDRELRRLANLVKKSEEEIGQMEQELAVIAKQLAENTGHDPEIFRKHKKLEEQLEAKIALWETQQIDYDQAKAGYETGK